MKLLNLNIFNYNLQLNYEKFILLESILIDSYFCLNKIFMFIYNFILKKYETSLYVD